MIDTRNYDYFPFFIKVNSSYQYKQGEIKIIMLDILKREKEISVKQLAHILKRKPAGRFYMQLKELRNKNLIRLEKGLVILNE